MWVGLSSGVGGVVLGVAARPGSRVGREPPWPSGASWSWSRLLDGDGSLRRLLAAMSLEDEGGKDGTEVVTRPGEVLEAGAESGFRAGQRVFAVPARRMRNARVFHFLG